MDRITSRSGWEILCRNSRPPFQEEGEFAWKNLHLKFNVEQGALTECRISSIDAGKPLEVTVLAFDPVVRQMTRAESDEMQRDFTISDKTPIFENSPKTGLD